MVTILTVAAPMVTALTDAFRSLQAVLSQVPALTRTSHEHPEDPHAHGAEPTSLAPPGQETVEEPPHALDDGSADWVFGLVSRTAARQHANSLRTSPAPLFAHYE